MALFGFAVNFTNGSTDYVIANGTTVELAQANVCLAIADCDGGDVESIVHYDAEAVVGEQYQDCAILSTQFGGC